VIESHGASCALHEHEEAMRQGSLLKLEALETLSWLQQSQKQPHRHGKKVDMPAAKKAIAQLA
jgi:hypothetical protein